jgi:hypothetical protein
MENLAPASDLATLLGVPPTDPKLLLALKRASGRFRGQVHHPVSLVANDTVQLDGDGSDTLLLPAAPVVGDVAVKIDGVTVTDHKVSRHAGILRRAAGWPDDLGNIEVTYTHGHTEIPVDVVDAVLEQAELQFKVLAGVQQASLGARSITFGTTASVGVTQRWVDAIEAHRLNRGDRS